MNHLTSNWFHKAFKNYFFLIAFSLCMLVAPFHVGAQCPLVAAACTGTPVSGAGNITIPAGATYYIPLGQTLSGNVTFGSGTSVLCIEGTWTGQFNGNPTAGATVNVYGIVNNTATGTYNGGGATINIYPGATFTTAGWGSNGGNFFFNNCGTMTTTGTFSTSSNVTVNNYGTFRTGGSLSTNGNLIFHNYPTGSIYVDGTGGFTFSNGTFINDGFICVLAATGFNGGSFINNACIATTGFGTNASNAFTNNSVVKIVGNFFNSGTNTTNNGTITMTGNFSNSGTFITGAGSLVTCVDWGSNGTIVGPASGCASFRATGYTTNSGTFSAANSSRIDFTDAGNPPPVGTPPAPMDNNNGNVNSATFTGTCTPTTYPSCTACCAAVVPGIAGTSTICNGNSTTLTGTGGGTYSWSPGGATTTSISVSPSVTSTYTVTVTSSGGCTATLARVVTVNSAPTPGITGTATICNGNSTTLTGTGGGTYSWSPGASTATSITVSPTSNTTYTVTVTNGSGCSATTAQVVTVNSLPTTTMGSTPATCGSSNGTATVTATGPATLTYLWNNGQTTVTAIGLSSGSYNVTVTDGNGCTRNSLVSVNNATGPTASFVSQTNVLCNGSATGSATVTGTGGTGTLTYSWSPGGQTTPAITGLTAGTYICTVTDANGCAQGQSVTITGPAAPISSGVSSQSNVGCTGAATGSATVTATGGTGGYTYNWLPAGGTNSSATGLTTGSYTVTITDANSCTQAQSVVITQPASAINSGIGSQTNVSCTGNATGSATITVTGGTPTYTYNWNTGATTAGISGLTAGTYSVIVSDANGCSQTQSVVITQPASALSSGVSTQSDVGCTGTATGSATVTVAGGTPTYTYSWSTGETTAGISGLTAGNYNVIITDTQGCITTNNITITQPTSAISSGIGGQTNVGCTGSATGSAIVTATGGTPTYTYNWSTGATTANISGLTAGTYSVIVSDANGCSQTQSVVITQPASAISSGIGSQTAVGCTGSATGSATVTVSGGTPTYTYNWSTGATTAGINGLTAGTYSVIVSDANGCSQTQSVAITQPASSVSSSISATDATCGNSNGTVSVTAIGGTPGYTYSWSSGAGTNATAGGLASGPYTVIITDLNGCTATASVSVNNAGAPTVGISGTVGNVNCTGSATGSATVTATGGTGTLIYSWNNGVTSTTGSATGLTAGTYIVTVTDANGCAQGQTINITQPAAAISSGISSQNGALCNGTATGSATVTATGGTPSYTYIWSHGATGSSATGLTAGTYTVTINDINNCTHQQQVTITEPTFVLSSGVSLQSDASCRGTATGSATITATGGTPTYTYSWNTGGTDAFANGLTAGTYSVTVTDVNGCSVLQLVTITEPAFVLSTSISLQTNAGCIGTATGAATVSASGGTPTYTYNWNTGATTAGIGGLTAGTYSVTVTDTKGCTQQQLVTITEPATFVSSASGSTNAACGSSNGTVSITATGGTPGYTYNWSNGATNALVSGLTAGTYSVTVTDNNGCTHDTIAVVAGSPGPTAGVSSQNNISCNGLTNGTATVTVSSGTAPYTYTWNPNVTANNTINTLSANTYTVVVSDSASCKDTVIFTITEPLPMTFSLSTSNASVCAGESLTILTTTPTGGTPPFTFNWLPNGPVVSPLVPTTYSVTVTDSSGCISQVDTIRVTPLPSPIAGFDTLSTGMFNTTYTFIDQSTGGTTWYWDFGDGNTSSLQNPVHSYQGAGTYTVIQIVISSSGCPDTITKVITIRPNILIPNIFTPNNDGVNDEFWIPSSGFESFELEIYNRWGTKLFVSNKGEVRWDGRTTAGVEVSDGTYYFMLKAILKTDTTPGKNYDAHGFINLHRSGGK